MNDIFVFGAGGHSKVILDVVEKQGLHQVVYLLDDHPESPGRKLRGVTVVGSKECFPIHKGKADTGLVAIGNNMVRRDVARWLHGNGAKFAVAIHPSACIGFNVALGCGTVLMAGAVVNPDTTVGEHVIINTGATVDHDCRIGSFVHIAPGTTLCGGVVVGDGTMIGAGSTVVPCVKIGAGVTIGAGASVICDIPDGMTVVGTPARPRIGKHE